MMTIYEQLWNGQLAPYKTCGQGDSELEELLHLVERNKSTLDGDLSEKQKVVLEKFIACYDEYQYLYTIHAFREGFSLASRLLSHALSE